MKDYSKLKVVELKEECKTRGITLTGLKLKQHFVDRLEEDDASKERRPSGSSDGVKLRRDELEKPQKVDQVVESSESEDDEGGEGEGQKEIGKGDVNGVVEEPQKDEDGEKAKDLDAILPDAPAPQVEATDSKEPAPERELPVQNGIPAEPEKPIEPAKQNTQEEATNAASGVDAEVQALKGATELFVGETPALDAMEVDAKQPEPASETIPGQDTTADTTVPDAPAVQPLSPSHSNQEATSTLPDDLTSKQSTPGSAQIPTLELAEDQRKRKRRSTSSVPLAEEIALKKAKRNDGTPVVTERETKALEQMKEANEEAKDIRVGEGSNEAEEPMRATEMLPATRPETIDDGPTFESTALAMEAALPSSTNLTQDQQPRRSPSPEASRDISPSIHPATPSLYIRNFKRPLHLPTLRAHISNLARSKSSTTEDTDPITLFYLDSIRTHAFISFTSIAAASRVRNAMHGTRWPEEKTRDFLWCDFIPASEVETWIDLESGAGSGGGLGGGRAGGRRWEVIYEDTDHGVRAKLLDAETASRYPILSHGAAHVRSANTTASTTGVRKDSLPLPPVSSRPLLSTSTPSTGQGVGIHPSRLPLVPRSPEQSRSLNPAFSTPQPPPAHPSNDKSSTENGRGFQPLNALFLSTTAKPKLYYKPVSAEIVAARRGMLARVREYGRSGGEGMKRYSFQNVDGHGYGRKNLERDEEWVDKGPEFGRGRRGAERFEGGSGNFGGGAGAGWSGGAGSGYAGGGSGRGGYRGHGGVGGGFRGGGGFRDTGGYTGSSGGGGGYRGRGGYAGGGGGDSWRR